MTTRDHDEHDDHDDALPWVIPVREPDPSVVAPSTAGLGQAVAVLALGVVAFAAAMIFGAGVLVEDTVDSDTAAGVPGDSGPDDGTEVRGNTVVVDVTSTTDALTSSPSEPVDPTSSTTSTSSTSTSSSTTSTTSTTTVDPTDTGTVPRLSSSFEGGWVAQLTSVPQDSGVERLEEAWDTLRTGVPEAVVAVSDEWSSLRPGYWVFVHPGPFGSSDQVASFCERVDRECIPRQLTR